MAQLMPQNTDMNDMAKHTKVLCPIGNQAKSTSGWT